MSTPKGVDIVFPKSTPSLPRAFEVYPWPYLKGRHVDIGDFVGGYKGYAHQLIHFALRVYPRVKSTKSTPGSAHKFVHGVKSAGQGRPLIVGCYLLWSEHERI